MNKIGAFFLSFLWIHPHTYPFFIPKSATWHSVCIYSIEVQSFLYKHSAFVLYMYICICYIRISSCCFLLFDLVCQTKCCLTYVLEPPVDQCSISQHHLWLYLLRSFVKYYYLCLVIYYIVVYLTVTILKLLLLYAFSINLLYKILQK